MSSKREKTPNRLMRTVALVICEGETEENYINLLKQWYRSPIQIVSHIEGSKIKQTLIDKRTRELKLSPIDTIHSFLMYDMDVPEVNDRLMSCKAELLLSNPCFELWLLLHAKDQKSTLNSASVIKELKACEHIWNNYKKSTFTATQQTFLRNNTKAAIKRAKQLADFQNPSSRVYKLIEILESVKMK